MPTVTQVSTVSNNNTSNPQAVSNKCLDLFFFPVDFTLYLASLFKTHAIAMLTVLLPRLPIAVTQFT